MTSMVCSHGDRRPAPCGDDRWCMEDAGHEGPHTGQGTRCACGLSYGAARERFIRTGDLAALERMLVKVTLTERPVADEVREAGFGPVPERIEVTYLQDPSAVLRWHYGPTATDPNPGSMWCYSCGSEVWTLEGGYICRGCGKQCDG